MFGVGKTDEGQVIRLPEFLKCLLIIRTDNQDLGILCGKFFVIQAQLHHMPAAVGLHEAVVEDQNDMLFNAEIGKADWMSI